MKTKILCSLAISVLFLVPLETYALVIAEVMYDPDGTDSGREWVEVWNDGSSAFDVTSAVLLEGDVRHRISAVSGASPVLEPGERAIVADKADIFTAEYPNVARVFDSAFSLANAGERLSLVRADGAEFSWVEWSESSGATGGKSWQVSGGSWIAAAATPGASNAVAEQVPTQAGGEEPPVKAISAHSGTGGLTKVTREPAMLLDAGRERVVPVGAEIEIRPTVDGASRASISWSWGDGDSSKGKVGRHRYRFPGTYAVVANARGAGGALSTSRTVVTAIPVAVSASAVSVDGELAVRLDSASSYEVNLGGFRVETPDYSYELPLDTIVLPNSFALIPAGLVGEKISLETKVSLRRPDGKIVSQAR